MLRCYSRVFYENPDVGKLKSRVFGQNVYRLRQAASLTQEQLAEKADISRRYVQLIESGKYTPTIQVAAKLRSAFAVSWDGIMKGL